jgi:hypothetical protein
MKKNISFWIFAEVLNLTSALANALSQNKISIGQMECLTINNNILLCYSIQ